MTAVVHLEPAAGAAVLRPRRRRVLALVVLVLVVALGGTVLAGRLGGPQPVRSVLLDRPAPPLVGPTLAGGTFDLEQWRGQVVLVNVWASWCVPCRREQPLLVAANEQLGPRGLKIVGIDVRDREQEANAFLAEYGNAPWPSVVDPDGRRAVDWGTFGLPETYLIDEGGTMVAKAVGELDAGWIQANVVPLLAPSVTAP